MDTKPPGKSHAVTWTLLALAVPALYMLTVPVVKYAVVRPQKTAISGRGVKRSSYVWTSTMRPPGWLVTYCAPYNWLMNETPLGPSLRHYQEWCFKLVQ